MMHAVRRLFSSVTGGDAKDDNAFDDDGFDDDSNDAFNDVFDDVLDDEALLNI